jgi:hypothetical protein
MLNSNFSFAKEEDRRPLNVTKGLIDLRVLSFQQILIYILGFY